MSRRKNALSWAIVVFALLLVGVAATYVLWPRLQPHATVRLGDGVFQARIAKTPAARTKGLSGTEQLAKDEALLLAFDHEDLWKIWMKDMNYPLDIVWLNKDKEVVYIVKNAPPQSYPHKQFTPKDAALYVLELSAGTVEEKAIVIGDRAAFDEKKLQEQP
jgi:uncharacterized membrane protein (UPF0127 family)